MSQEVLISDLPLQDWKSPVGGSVEEFIAHLLEQGKLLSASTQINGQGAKALSQAYKTRVQYYREGTPLGQLLINGKILTKEQLLQALEQQKTTTKPLGEIVVELGFCDGPTVNSLLEKQKAHRQELSNWNKLFGSNMIEELLAGAMMHNGLLNENAMINGRSAKELAEAYTKKLTFMKDLTKMGGLLVKTNIITTEHLSEALVYQQTDPIPLGQILIKLGHCTQEAIDTVLQQQQAMRQEIATAQLTQNKPPN